MKFRYDKNKNLISDDVFVVMRDEEDDEYYEDLDETEPVKPTNRGIYSFLFYLSKFWKILFLTQ